MTGNVWELCQDFYNGTIETTRGTDYVCMIASDQHVLRGRSMGASENNCVLNSTVSRIADLVTGDIYQGFRLVLADKRYPTVSSASPSDIGKVICSNGHIHATVSDITCGGTAGAIISYVGTAGTIDSSSEIYKGLAIALKDAYSGTTTYCSQESETCLESQAATWDVALNDFSGITGTSKLVNHASHTHAAANYTVNYIVPGFTPSSLGCSSWFLPSIGQWNLIVTGLTGVDTGLTGTPNNDYQRMAVNVKIEAAGGTGLINIPYWGTTECSSLLAWRYRADYGDLTAISKNSEPRRVRAVLAF